MSKQELRRVEVLTDVLAGRRNMESAAGVLGVSFEAQRLAAKYRDGGGAALIHEARGRPATNTFNAGVRDYVLELVRQNYRHFGPTLAAEALLEREGVEVSRETLRKWMVEAGLWLSRRQRRTFHQPRLRRESYGELVQIDGTQRCWFEDRVEPCTLLVFIDDATSKLMQLHFVPSESTSSHFEACRAILKANGGYGLAHKARGRTSNRTHRPGVREFAVELVGSHYADFGPTLATEVLAERHAIHVGRETLRRWTMAEGVWLSLKLSADRDLRSSFLSQLSRPPLVLGSESHELEKTRSHEQVGLSARVLQATLVSLGCSL